MDSKKTFLSLTMTTVKSQNPVGQPMTIYEYIYMKIGRENKEKPAFLSEIRPNYEKLIHWLCISSTQKHMSWCFAYRKLVLCF